MNTALGLKSEERMIRKGYIRYLIPTTVALCFSQIAPLVDSLCISEVMGEEALSAMSTVSPIYYIFNIIGSFAGIGGGIAVAKAMGSGDKYAGGRAFTKALLWTTVSTLILSVLILIFIDPLLKLLCATEGNFMYAKEYLRVLVAGMVFYVINYSMTYILTDDNDANLSMAVGIVSGIVNMIVDVVGMFVLHQGIWVTAFGTVFGMFVGCLVCLVHMRKKDRICRFTPKKAGVPDIKLTEIMSPGMPEASEYLLFALQMLQSNYILSSSIGTSGLGNAAVIENLELISTIIIAGISESVLPLFASYHGEGNTDINRIVKRTVIILGEALMIPFVLSLIIFPQWLMMVFSIEEPVMMETLPRAIRIMAVAQLAAMMNAILVSFMQSTDDEKRATISYFIQGVIQISVMAALSKTERTDAPWFATLAAYTTVLLYFIFYCKQFKGLFSNDFKHILMIDGGRTDEAVFKDWVDNSGKILRAEESSMLWEKLFAPLINVLSKEKTYPCTFMIISCEDGHRAAILRYDSRKDLMGGPDNEDENGDEDEDSETIYNECIRSEFNYVRRMMINFE